MKFNVLIFIITIILSVLFIGCTDNEKSVPPVREMESFPYDSDRAHDRDFQPTGELTQLSENLYRLEDCCNVYVVKNGSRALLIDFGSGEILDRLEKIGITRIEKVLVTHHHRDQVQGLCDLGNYGFSVTVPAKEAHFFENVEYFWSDVQVYINYNCRSHWNTIRKSIKVSDKAKGGDIIQWGGIDFKVIETPGSTDGAVSYAADIDGRRLVFSGDLISGRGRVTNWFDMHWDYYGFTQGIKASYLSFDRVKAENPDILLPSHGGQIDEPAAAMEKNIGIYEKLSDMLIPNELYRQKREVREILPHLAYIGNNCYGIISKSGKAFLYDYGYTKREDLQEFIKRFNIKKIDAASFSHYHDDHNYRVYELLHFDNPRLWIFENMLEVFEHPERFRIPCLLPFPIKADRVLKDGEKVKWEEYTLECFHMPGQTEYHQGLVTKIDGKTVMFTGDNTWNKLWNDKTRNGPVVPQNIYFLDGGYITCAKKMLEYMPDMVCPAHTEEYFPTRPDLEEFLQWAYTLRDVMTGLIDQPDPNFGMDYQWCRFYPYKTDLTENEDEVRVEVLIRNHLFKPADVKLVLKHSDNIVCRQPVRTFTIEAKKQAAVPFILKKGNSGISGRDVITADITVNGHRIGEYTEGLIDL
ncbi:MBL fold metallo-hydrolase [candidate division KSB1 bacterium]